MFLTSFLQSWIERHRTPLNIALHAVGIPLAFVGPVVLAILGEWWWAAGAFVTGYVLQFIGHAVEGNDAGEIILIKKMLGMEYTAVAERQSKAVEPEVPIPEGRRETGQGGSKNAEATEWQNES